LQSNCDFDNKVRKTINTSEAIIMTFIKRTQTIGMIQILNVKNDGHVHPDTFKSINEVLY